MLANFSNLITFSRGSNATVTDASGRLTYAPHNLVTNSETFENTAWASGVTTAVTANTALSPVGTQTADTATINSTTTMVRQIGTSIVTIGASYILSVWVKASASSPAANTRLTVNNTASWTGAASTKVALTSQWQRISLPWTANGTGFYFMIGAIDATSANDTTCHGNVDLWGAQLEAVTYQTTPSPYVSTSVANLLGFSEDFTNAVWTKSNCSVVIGMDQNPINNLWNAQKLMVDTATAIHRVAGAATVNVIAGVRYTLSVYAKAAGTRYLYMNYAAQLNAASTFDLQTGTVSATASGTASITSVGNGWYRCSVTGIAPATAGSTFYLQLNDTGVASDRSYTGDGNSGIYIYGAQLSNSGSLDPYVPTPGAAPSSTAYYGPRFDYDPVTLAAKGILIEEQRTNLVTYSEQFDNPAWVKTRASITANATTSPDGTADADKLVEDTSTNTHFVTQSATVVASTTYTYSVYLKGAGRGFAQVRYENSGSTQFFAVNVDLSSGAVTTASFGSPTGTAASATNAGNGWWRVNLTVTASNTTFQAVIFSQAVSGTNSYTGDGTSGLFLYGAQLEAGAFATSYIPTVASTVTRSADVASITGSLFSQWYRQDEGTLVASWDVSNINNANGANVVSAYLDGNNLIRTWIWSGAQSTPRGTVLAGGVSSADLTSGTVAANTTIKTAMVYKQNDFGFSLNGGAAVTDTSGSVPSGINLLGIGQIGAAAGAPLNGHIQNITYIPNAISGTQLQSQTAS